MNKISDNRRGVGLQKYLKSGGDYGVIGGRNIFRYGIFGTKGFLSLKELKQNNNKLKFLKQPKIISQSLVAHIQNPSPHIKLMAAYDSIGDILSVDTVENTVLLNKNFDYRFILAIMNSTFMSWYAYKFIFCSAIRTMRLDNYYIGKMPIPNISSVQQNIVIELVDKILEITSSEDYLKSFVKKTKVHEWEKIIDHMVYKLYGLTEEEVKIIEEE